MKQEILNCSVSLTLTHYNELPEVELYHNDQKLNIDFKTQISNNILNALTKHFLTTNSFNKEFKLTPLVGKQKIELIFKNSHLTNKTLAMQTALTIRDLTINNFRLSTRNILLRNSKFYSNNRKIEQNIKEFPLFLRTDGKFIFEFETPFVTWAIKQF
jgi:hypothetical protein